MNQTAARRSILPDGQLIPRGGAWALMWRLRNRAIASCQERILDSFGRLPDVPARWMAHAARRLVGAHLYSVKLEVNTRCTLHCRMCYVQHAEQELDFATVRQLLDQLRHGGVRLEILGGEPLLHHALLEIVDYAKRSARLPFVSLYTNAVVASPELSHRLHAAQLDAVIVTLISHRCAVHDAETGVPGSWARTVEGIRNLRQAGIRTYTLTPLQRANLPDHQLIYRFAREELGAHALFFPYIPQARDDPMAVDAREWHDAKHWILAERNPEHMEYLSRFLRLTGNACSGGNFVLTVKVDGSVQPCPFVSDLPLGNIHARGLWAIYGARYQGTQLSEMKRLPDGCRACSHASVCGGGCRAGNRLQYGSYGVRDTRCLGPWSDRIDRSTVTDHVPCFF